MATMQEAAKLLLGQDFITILCHRSPDGDTLGSGYALLHALRSIGKRARLLCADPPPPDLVPILGEVAQDSFDEQFVVAVDVADSKLLGTLAEQYADKVNLVIDHHGSNREYGKALWLRPDAAATCEMMATLLAAMDITFTTQIATCLYLGIVTDTGCFRYASTTPDTMRTAADLMECGVDTGDINRRLFESKTRGRLAVESEAIHGIEYYYDGRCAVMTIPMALVQQNGMNDNELEGMASLPRQIEGVWVGITIREQPDHCRVSVRTTREADAAAICGAFGGGGHLRAGGCSMRGTPSEVKAKLLEETSRQLDSKEN